MPRYLITLCCCFYLNANMAQQPILGIPKGHLAEIYAPSFSTNGKLFVTPSADNTAKVWEAQTGRLIFNLEGHTNQLLSATFTTDNKYIITAGDHSIISWDAATGKIKYRVYHGNIPPINFNKLAGQVIYTSSLEAVNFSKNGKLMASASTDSSVIVWDIKTGKKLQQFLFQQKVKTVVFTGNDLQLITVTSDNQVGLWDITTSKYVQQLIPTAKNILSVTISPNEKIIMTKTDTDGSIFLWDVVTGKELFHLSKNDRLMSASWSKDGTRIVGSGLHKSYVWSATTGALTFELTGHNSWVYNAIFSPDGKKIITSGKDLSIKIYDAANGLLLHNLQGHRAKINGLSCSPDGKQLVSTSDDRTAITWNLEKGSMVNQSAGAGNEVYFAKLSADGKYMITASADNHAIVWDMEAGKIKHILKGHSNWIYFADFSKTNQWIVTTSTDKTAKVWSLQTGSLLQTLQGHSDVVNAAQFDAAQTKLVTASDDKTAKLWDLATGKLMFTFSHTEQVKTAVFSPDGKDVLTASFDKTAKIWNVATGQLSTTLLGHQSMLRTASYSADGKYIVTASGDETAKVWDAAKGNCIVTLKGHTGFVYNAAFGTGNKVYTAALDSTLKIWNASNGKLLQTIALNGSSIKSLETFAGKTAFLSKRDALYYISDSLYEEKVAVFFKDSLCLLLTPQGNYMGDKETVKQLYYIKGVESLGYDQLDLRYNRPDKVLTAVGEVSGNKNTRLIQSYQKAYSKRLQKLLMDTTSFDNRFSIPELLITNEEQIAREQTTEKIRLQFKGADSIFRLQRFNIWINETPLYGQKGIDLTSKNTRRFDSSITINLSQGKNIIEASVTNANGTESYRIPLTIAYNPLQPVKEKLYFIGIGIDKFAETTYNLNYCTKDVRDLSRKLKEKYTNDITIDTLFNEQVTAKNIISLKSKLLNSNINDKVILSYSGHGLLSKDFDYYLSTFGVNFEKPEEGGLPYDSLESLMDGIPARKKLLLIDACHSGEVDKEEMQRYAGTPIVGDGINKGVIKLIKGDQSLGMKNSFELMQELFVNVGRRTGATIISAAGGTQFAQERGDLKNGVFTFSILEYMKNHPSATVSQLKNYVNKRVPELTKGLQVPTTRSAPKLLDWEVW